MKKYLLVIARYKDQRQNFFENLISPLNKKYCEKWGFEYIEIKNDVDLPIYRNNPTWWKFTILRDMLKDGRIQDGDIFTHLDADMVIVDFEKEYKTNKSFSYSIDSGNTHCMGSYSIKVNDWSRKLIDLILDEDRYQKLNDRVTQHEAFGHFSSFWHEFREQASWYSLSGVKRHSWMPFTELPNYGWHSDKNEDTYYSLEDLYENVEILSADWNVTELEGETGGQFNINKSKKENVIIRHFAGGQPWRSEWIQTNLFS
jgi:hypothetical protein